MIGRSPYCSIVLSNSRASRQHCAITWDEHGLALSDLGSSNGTSLNGTEVTGRTKLQAGDVLMVGTDMLEVLEVQRKATAGITRTEQGPALALEDDEFDDAQSTKRQEMTLEFIEAIASGAVEDGRSIKAATAVTRAVDLFLKLLSESGRRLAPQEASRLATVTELVGAHHRSGTLTAWKARTIESISRHAMSEESV